MKPFRITPKPWPSRLRDVQTAGRLKAVTRRKISNSAGEVPAGTIGHVEAGSSWNRLEFIAEECRCCGAKFHLTRLNRDDVELIED